jgi:hypothetical protein
MYPFHSGKIALYLLRVSYKEASLIVVPGDMQILQMVVAVLEE